MHQKGFGSEVWISSQTISRTSQGVPSLPKSLRRRADGVAECMVGWRAPTCSGLATKKVLEDGAPQIIFSHIHSGS